MASLAGLAIAPIRSVRFSRHVPTQSRNLPVLDIPAIEKLCKAATEGRWRGSNDFGHHLDIKATMLVADFGNSFLALGRVIHRENLEFIAQARTLVPQLVEALEEAQAENARLQTELKMARACDSDALMVSELACLQARVEEAEQQLRDQVAGDLGDYLEVVGRGVQVLNYVDMMLLPRMEGLAESLQASYEHTAKLEARAERAEQECEAAKGLPTDSEVCHSCRSAVALIWAAKNEDWDKVVGGPSGIRCAKCFAAEAEKCGINLAYIAVPLADGWRTDWYGDLEVENARLQARVEEAEAQLQPYAVGPLGEPFFKTKADAERALAQVEGESDRYKALLERVDALCQSKLDEPPEGSFIALQDAEKAFATEVATIVADAFLSSSGFALVAYKALAEEAEAERDTAIRERYKAIERGVCAVEVAQYYHLRWTTEKQDMVVLRDMWRQAEALAERREEALDAWGRYSLSSKPSKELLVEALRLTDAAEEPR